MVMRIDCISVACALMIFGIARGQVCPGRPAPCHPTSKDIDSAFKECSNVEKEREQLEIRLVQEGKVIREDQRTADLCILRRKSTDLSVHLRELKQLQLIATTDLLLSEKYGLTCQEIDDLSQDSLTGSYAKQARAACLGAISNTQCGRSQSYRTMDGTCNNMQNPAWGSSGSCFRRLLPPRYTGASGFRQSVAGGSLPQPRDLSLNVHSHLNRPTNYVTHMYMFFGQLLDHDISQAPFSVTMDNQAINCCPESANSHPQCAPITIRANDPFYAQFGTRCMNLVRSAMCPTCNLGSRQQINQITAYIDGSFIYGNSLNETSGLRSNDGTGRLRVESSAIGDLMPSSVDPPNDQCSFVNTSDICFQAGDARANQHTTLASLHTIFVREHNRLADGLRSINRFWDEETIFQEARKILGAQMQVITYEEFLPETLGADRMSYFSLWLSKQGRTRYDASVDATLFNEFSTAAFRFGHSLINGVVTQSPRTNGNSLRLLRDEFFQPFELRTGLIDPLLSGVSRSPAQWFDRYLVPDVTNYLYRIRGQPAGLDLASINIQRGRDHGMPTYVDMVAFCSDNQFSIRQFSDLVKYGIMNNNNMQILQRNYRNVNDIDLWTGILSEDPGEGAVVGPTGACVIGEQFKNLKFGDRFYFEHGNQLGSFSYQQIQELKKTTLSKIMCLNSGIAQLPLNAMLFISKNNPTINCRYVRGIDLSYWRA